MVILIISVSRSDISSEKRQIKLLFIVSKFSELLFNDNVDKVANACLQNSFSV